MRFQVQIAFAALLATLPAAPLSTQERDGPAGPTRAELRRQQEMARRVPVTIALVDELPAPDSVPTVILRRANTSPHDVILLRRNDANGGQLAAAVLHLLVLRDRSGDTARVNATYRLPAARQAPRAWQRTEEVRTGRVVARLRRAEPSEVPGVGRVRATEIYLPSAAMRDEARRAARPGL
jgi:hypothetical protein